MRDHISSNLLIQQLPDDSPFTLPERKRGLDHTVDDATYTIRCGVCRPFSLEELQDLAAQLDASNVYVELGETDMCGGVEESCVRMTVPTYILRKWYYTGPETEELDKSRWKRSKDQEKKRVIEQAKKLGLKVEE